MNHLDPEIRRLLRWAKTAPPRARPVMPAGLAGRIVARWLSGPEPDPWLLWQRAVWASAWAAVAVIGIGLVLLNSQRLGTGSAYDFSPAYQVVSTELVP